MVKSEVVWFNGIKFTRYPESRHASARNYFHAHWRQKKHGYTTLHRAVWEHHYGPVPKDCHIHHRDHDRSNNDISNLVCLTSSEHSALHYPEKVISNKESLRAASAKGRSGVEQWRKSDAGREFYTTFGVTTRFQKGHELPIRQLICPECGINFETRCVTGKFCTTKCGQAHRYRNSLFASITCLHCHKTVAVPKVRSTGKYCSYKCAYADRTTSRVQLDGGETA